MYFLNPHLHTRNLRIIHFKLNLKLGVKVRPRIKSVGCTSLMMMMMMILCPKAGSLAFTTPGNEMSEMVSLCLPHRQLWVSNLSKVATQFLEVDSNLRPSNCKAQNLPLHHRAPV